MKLPAQDELLKPGTLGVVSGWGFTTNSDEKMSEQLRAVEVPLESQNTCIQAYGFVSITDRMICAGFINGGKDSCQVKKFLIIVVQLFTVTYIHRAIPVGRLLLVEFYMGLCHGVSSVVKPDFLEFTLKCLHFVTTYELILMYNNKLK